MANIQLIIFERENCPPCRSSRPAFKKFLENHPEISSMVFDTRKDGEFFHFFNIDTVPAFIVRQQGRNVLKYIGMVDYETLEKIYKEKIKCT